jgi:ABC-type polysaccharide/polyol phosphate export permease
LVRDPLLDHAPDGYQWAMAGGFAVVGWTMALWLYQRAHARIAYWV